MPTEFSRTLRVGEQIHRELAQLVHTVVKDPRIGMVTIVGVEVSRDLAHARVYFTVFGGDEAHSASQAGLNRAAGFLRRELGRRIKTRAVPELRFVYDETQRKGAKLDALISEAVKRDSRREH
jgi:ribosome-binding factor A